MTWSFYYQLTRNITKYFVQSSTAWTNICVEKSNPTNFSLFKVLQCCFVCVPRSFARLASLKSACPQPANICASGANDNVQPTHLWDRFTRNSTHSCHPTILTSSSSCYSSHVLHLDCFPHFPHFHCMRCSKPTKSALVLLCQAWFFIFSPGNSADLISLCLQAGSCIALFFFHLNLLVPSTGSNTTILHHQTSFYFLP